MLQSTASRVGVLVLGAVILGLAWWLGSPLFLNRTVQEAFPYSADAVVPDSMTREAVERVMAELATTEQSVGEDMPAAADRVTALKAGRFRDADGFHRGSGVATIYRLPSGGHVLRFEDFSVTNGPDLRVLLSPHPDPDSRATLHEAGFVEVAALKGNRGSQNYALPADLDLGSVRSTIIYCRPFQVIFSVAPLR